jgi:DNA-binding Lrp family transcriptional regulator
VRELQLDGRASAQSLADRIGLSRGAARARVQRLLEAGVVRVVGIVHADVAGMGAIAHVSVAVEGSSRELAAGAAAREAATFVSRIAGEYALIVELRAGDDGALALELDWLRAQPSVHRVDVFRCAAAVKDAYSVVRELEPLALDAVDWRLLQELQRDGRVPYTRLAASVGLSQAATRARVVRLMESGTVHISGLVDSAALGVREGAGLGLQVGGDARAAAERIADLPGLNYVLTGFGRFDVICCADAPSRAELLELVDAVRARPEVRALETWYHLDVVKESYAVDLVQAAARADGRPR